MSGIRDRLKELKFGRNKTSSLAEGELRAELFFAIEELAPHVVKDLHFRSPEAWANHWFGGATWAVLQAETTLALWPDSPRTESSCQFGRILKGSQTIFEAGTESFQYVEWNPQTESRAQAKRRILAEFDQHLEVEMERSDPGHTWGRIPATTVLKSETVGKGEDSQPSWGGMPVSTVVQRDIWWLVQYQYLEKPSATIALMSEPDPNSAKRNVAADQVDIAVRRMLGRLGIPRRTGNQPGRPPKTTGQ